MTEPAAHDTTSTGIPPRLAAVLAYGGWWITGLLFWWVERDNAYVRFHAAQSTAAFGLLALAIAGFGTLALASLSVVPAAFGPFLWAAGATWIASIVLCAAAMWQAALGHRWRMPIAGPLAERMLRPR